MVKTNIVFTQPWTSDYGPISENRNYNIGSNVPIAWDVTLEYAFVTLNQVPAPFESGGPYAILPGYVSGTSWSWTVNYEGLDPSNAWLGMYYLSMEDSINYGTTIYFNITDPATSSTTSTPSSTTMSSTSAAVATTTDLSASSTISAFTNVATATNTSTATASTIQTGTVVGIAIGVVGAAFLLAGALFWAWRRRMSRKRRLATAPGTQVPDMSGHNSSGTKSNAPCADYLPGGLRAHETAGSPLYEADGTPTRPPPAELHI